MASTSTKRALQPALLQVKGLSKRFAQHPPFSRRKFVVDALKNVDLDIQPYCVTAVIGESGSGKSTLAACIASLQEPDSGQIWFEGNKISHASGRELALLRPKIQLVFQDSAGALNPYLNVAQIIEEPLEIQKLASGRELRHRACELIEQVGLSLHCADRSPLQLSGGQRQRVAIARALALQPVLLILDESLSGLDLIARAEILKLLLQLRSSHSLTYLLISHDVSLVGQAADFVAVMHQGTIVEQGTRANVLNAPRHQHTRELVASARILESRFHDLQPERDA